MNVTIHYKAESRAFQSGTFQLRGKRPEQVAFEFWKQIKREMSYHAELEKVIINGDQDITQIVIDIEKQEWKKNDNIDLPF